MKIQEMDAIMDSRNVKMVDVGYKPPVAREAVAEGEIILSPSTIDKIRKNELEKGDVVTASKLAGIMAAKRTPELLPLCHPLSLTNVDVEIEIQDKKVLARAKVKATERTGVEMEALTAVCATLLNIWDMTKMYEKDENGQYPTTSIQGIRVTRKLKG